MSDLRDLLRQHGAPAPNAMAMPGETRSDDGLYFEVVTGPVNTTVPITTIAEWSCMMGWKGIEALQTFLKTPYRSTGRTPDQLFDDAMKHLGIGGYIGTFLGKHTGGSEVRMLLSYTPEAGKTIEQIYQDWDGFLTNPPGPMADTAAAIKELRERWLAGKERTQAGLMLLTGVDLPKRLGDSSKFPFYSIDQNFS
jgi:hypothetical protein